MPISNSGNNSGVIASNIGTVNVLPTRPVPPVLIIKLVEILAAQNMDALDERYGISAEDLRPFDISAKIDYNNLVRNRMLIDELAIYYDTCSDALGTLDNNDIGAKSRLLCCVRTIYREYKSAIIGQYLGQGLSDLDVINKHSDDAIDHVVEELTQMINSGYQNERIFAEDIKNAVRIFTAYAFAECKILEKPR